MAAANLVVLFPVVHPIILTQRHRTRLSPNGFPSLRTTRAMGTDFLGDFGARDPFPAELESRFGEKVLGNGNTEHKILIPNISALSLSQQDCSPISPLQPPFSQEDATQLVRKRESCGLVDGAVNQVHVYDELSDAQALRVLGWRLVNEEGVLKLQCLWKLRDFKCGVELINRISKVAEAAGHFPNIHLEQPNQVRAELWTASIGGLSLNDFIVAAKIDEIKTSDLVPRKRIWA